MRTRRRPTVNPRVAYGLIMRWAFAGCDSGNDSAGPKPEKERVQANPGSGDG